VFGSIYNIIDKYIEGVDSEWQLNTKNKSHATDASMRRFAVRNPN
jgi:hypothetical protein